MADLAALTAAVEAGNRTAAAKRLGIDLVAERKNWNPDAG